MILKNNGISFKMTINDSDITDGLGDGDYWCRIIMHVRSDDVNFELDNYMLSKKELFYLRDKLIQFVNGEIKKRERISFIKNFLIIYLYGSKKEMELKLIHVNSKKINYSIIFSYDEILKFIDILN